MRRATIHALVFASLLFTWQGLKTNVKNSTGLLTHASQSWQMQVTRIIIIWLPSSFHGMSLGLTRPIIDTIIVLIEKLFIV